MLSHAAWGQVASGMSLDACDSLGVQPPWGWPRWLWGSLRGGAPERGERRRNAKAGVVGERQLGPSVRVEATGQTALPAADRRDSDSSVGPSTRVSSGCFPRVDSVRLLGDCSRRVNISSPFLLCGKSGPNQDISDSCLWGSAPVPSRDHVSAGHQATRSRLGGRRESCQHLPGNPLLSRQQALSIVFHL